MSENPLVGYWKLVTCDAIRKHGRRVPLYGKEPVGRLYYDDWGNMSVHIMRSGRGRNGSGSDSAPGATESTTAHDGYQAYFSTYTVDTKHRTIYHHVLGSLYPEWTGTTQVRYYEIRAGDRLLLRTAPIDSPPGGETVFELVWERLK